MPSRRSNPIAVGIVALLVAIPVFYFAVLIDHRDQPLCHKQIVLSFLARMTDEGTNVFPNVSGLSSNSLAIMSEAVGGLPFEKKYNYVPGLREGDPSHLVLMYLKRPTRWMHHGLPRSVFHKKAWVIVPLDENPGNLPVSAERGELSENVSREEFRVRLQQTLDFVRTNERPNWQAVVAEHSRFLQTIEDERR